MGKTTQLISELGRRMMEWGAAGGGNKYGGSLYLSNLFGDDIESGGQCNISESSIVSICYEFAARKFVEALPVVQSRAKGDSQGWETDESHPLVQLLNSNPVYDLSHLLAATVVDLMRGNAYWIIARGPTGKASELWWMPKQCMQVIPQPDGRGGPMAYTTSVANISTMWWPEDVIHFRGFRPDPNSFLLGLDPLGPQVPHIRVDNEAAKYTEAIMRNLGIPGAVFTAKDAMKIMSEGSANDLKLRYADSTSGDKRGQAIIIDAPYDVSYPNVSPDNMALEDIGDTAEERIPAALMLNAMALQLGAGLKRATFSNYQDSLKAAFDNGVAPLHRIVSGTITRRLVPETGGDPKQTRAWFDYSDIPSLQEDKNAMHDRLRKDFSAGGIDRMTFKQKLGYKADEAKDTDVYAMPGPDTNAIDAGDMAATALPAAKRHTHHHETRAAPSANNLSEARYTPADIERALELAEPGTRAIMLAKPESDGE